MERNTDVQYDDDLTVGADDYDESLYDGDIDLFEYVGEEESAITRLKTIILSIDWEITDDILRELNEELHELKDIWSSEKIHLVYVQALEKLSKYIYQERADANPNAIKLLLTFYTDLEKIVLDENMDEDEKKRILIEDVDRFEKFKKLISPPSSQSSAGTTITPEPPHASQPSPKTKEDSQEYPGLFSDNEDILLNLKAIVFGIDWEITAKDLEKLDNEVQVLKNTFSQSKVRILFLQGIETLGNYINVKRSDAHIDAFKLLHTFFAGIETVVKGELSYQEEKALLLQEVEKFNAFKNEISKNLAPGEFESFSSRDESTQEDIHDHNGELVPALSGFDEEITKSEEQPVALEEDPTVDLNEDDKVEDITTEMASRLENFFGDDMDELDVAATPEELALQGVAVETEADDDSDEEELPRFGDALAPALSDDLDENFEGGTSPGAIAGVDSEEEINSRVDGLFGDDFIEDEADESIFSGDTDSGDLTPALGFIDDEESPVESFGSSDSSSEVDSQLNNFFDDEPVAPAFDDEPVSPALAEMDVEDKGDTVAGLSDEPPTEITDRLEGFFDDGPAAPDFTDNAAALQGVDVETEADDDSDEAPLLFDGDEVAPALGGDDESLDLETSSEESKTDTLNDDLQNRIEGFFDDEPSAPTFDDSEVALQGVDVESEADDDSEEAPLLFDGDEVAPALGGDDELFTEALEPEKDIDETQDEISEKLDGFFDDTSSQPLLEPEIEETEVTNDAIFEETESVVDDTGGSSDEINNRLEDFFDDKDETLLSEDSGIALQGVEVETDADDDSDEAPLPLEGDEVAPALGSDESEIEVVSGSSALLDDEYSFGEYDEDGDDGDSLLGSVVNANESDTVGAAIESEPPVAGSGVVFEAVDEPQVVFEAVDDEEDQDDLFVPLDDEEDQGDLLVSLDDEEDQDDLLVSLDDEEGQDDLFSSLDDSDDDNLEFKPVDDESALASAFLDKIDEAEDIDDEDLVNIIEEEVDEHSLIDDIEILDEDELLESHLIETETFDSLIDLQNSINSEGGVVSEETLMTLNNEILSLSEQFEDRPLEKTFLQLMTSVSHYLGRNKGKVNQEANAMLFSLIDKLEVASIADTATAQSTLQAETQKVLIWQQRVIEELMSKPVGDESDLLGVGVTEGLLSNTLDDDGLGQIGGLDAQATNDSIQKNLTSLLSDEFSAMREEFKTEMKRLRQEIKDEIK